MKKSSIVLSIATLALLAVASFLSLRTCTMQDEGRSLIQQQRELNAYGRGFHWGNCIHVHGFTREECDKQYPTPGKEPTP